MTYHGIDSRLHGEKIGPSTYEIEGYRVRKLRRSLWRAEKGSELISLDSFNAIQAAILKRIGK